MGTFLPAFLVIIYFGAIISVVIYMILLFIRLVNAIEKIANSIENCCKNKTSQPG